MEITNISPNVGPSMGGTVVSISGAGLAEPGKAYGGIVCFGSVCIQPGSQNFGIGDSLVAVVTPNHEPGTVDVTITRTDGEVCVYPGGFTFLGEEMTTGITHFGVSQIDRTIDIYTRAFPVYAGTAFSVSVHGSGFSGFGSVGVYFNGNTYAGTWVSDNEISAVIPAQASGLYSVQALLNGVPQQIPNETHILVSAMPPVITSLTPNVWDSGGGVTATITGTNFQPSGSVVKVDGIPVSATVTSTSAVFQVPPHAPGTVTVTITNPDGQSASASAIYTVSSLPAPVITSLSPSSIPETGGTVIINGTGFQSGATVTICSISVPVTYISATQLQIAVPAMQTDGILYCPVVVTNPDGQFDVFEGYLTIQDTVLPAPTISGTNGITPDTGPETGNTAVTIAGSGFQAGASVTFGGNPATQVIVVNSSTITCKTPAGTAGAVDVVVTNPDTQSATATEGYTYTEVSASAPSVTSLSPTHGTAAGGTTVTITGSDFVDGATVTICGVSVSVTYVSVTELSITTPAHAAGTCPLIVTNPDGQTDMETFTYDPVTAAAPSINGENGILPASGPDTGGTTVLITGSGYQNGASVSFGGLPAVQVTVLSATQIAAVTPAHAAGWVTVTVTNPDAQSVSVPNGFVFLPSTGQTTTITDVSPSEGPCSGGTMIMITGTGFQSGATVTICGLNADVIEVHPDYILARTPVMSGVCWNACDVMVTNPDGSAALWEDGFSPVPESEMYDTFPLRRNPSQTVLTGLKVIRKKGELTAVLPLFDTLKDALENCLQPGDFYRTSDGHVMIVPHLDYAPEDGV